MYVQLYIGPPDVIWGTLWIYNQDHCVYAPNQWDGVINVTSLIGWAHSQNGPCIISHSPAIVHFDHSFVASSCSMVDEIPQVPQFNPRGPFYWYGLTLIPAWINNHMPKKVWDGVIYSFANFKSCTIEVREWTSNFIEPTIMDVVTNSWRDES